MPEGAPKYLDGVPMVESSDQIFLYDCEVSGGKEDGQIVTAIAISVEGELDVVLSLTDEALTEFVDMLLDVIEEKGLL